MMDTQYKLFTARMYATEIHTDLTKSCERYASRSDAVQSYVERNREQIDKFAQAFDIMDDLVIELMAEINNAKVQAYQKGYQKGKNDNIVSFSKPSKFDREEYRRWTISKALQESEQIQLESYGIIQYTNN